jgi:hypothetical protein
MRRPRAGFAMITFAVCTTVVCSFILLSIAAKEFFDGN